MHLKQVTVKGLFDTFDHEILMNEDGRVTLIYGPNGFGKTTLLRMIDALMHARYTEIVDIQFAMLRVEYTTGDFIEVVRVPYVNPQTATVTFVPSQEEDEFAWGLEITYKYGRAEETYRPSQMRSHSISEATLSGLSRSIPELTRIAEKHWRYGPTAEVLSLDEVIERFDEQLPQDLIAPSDEPGELRDLRRGINVRFVKTQRLDTPILSRPQMRDRSLSLGPMVVQYSKELRETLGRSLAEYGRKSQLLDRTFPNRVFRQLQGQKQDKEDVLSGQQLQEMLQVQEQQVVRYQTAGLLESQDAPSNSIPVTGQYEDATERVLSVYVKDNEQKLGALEHLACQIELLKSIINENFAYKRIEVSRTRGFKLVSKRLSEEEIPLSNLSSGEQHLLVLTYELLFKTTKDTLIIIDEPEISLHVVWQEEFLKNLQRIVQLNPFEALIATHSPQIIADRWDLTQGLTGPDDANDSMEDFDA